MTYVKVIERRPPPAPARAWAMLSPCWAADVARVIASLLGAAGWDIVVFMRFQFDWWCCAEVQRNVGKAEVSGKKGSPALPLLLILNINLDAGDVFIVHHLLSYTLVRRNSLKFLMVSEWHCPKRKRIEKEKKRPAPRFCCAQRCPMTMNQNPQEENLVERVVNAKSKCQTWIRSPGRRYLVQSRLW